MFHKSWPKILCFFFYRVPLHDLHLLKRYSASLYQWLHATNPFQLNLICWVFTTIRDKTRYTHFSNLSSHHLQARSSFGGRYPWATCSAPQPRTGNRQSPLTAHSHAPPAWCSQRCRRSSQGSLSSGPGQRTHACCSCHCAGWHGMEATFCGISCRAERLGHNMVSKCTIRPNTTTAILEWYNRSMTST